MNAVNPGFDTRNLLTGEIIIPRGRFAGPIERARFFETLRQDFAAVPGVKAVGFINNLPIRNEGSNVPLWAPDRPPKSSSDWQMAFQRSVLPGYFEAMRIPLLAGRDMSSTDSADSPKVLVASAQMARTLFPCKNALGQTVMVDVGGAQAVPLEIVGVVGNVRGGDELSRPPRMMMYRSHRQVPSSVMRFAVRTGLNPDALAQTIRKLVLARDRDIPVEELKSMEHLISTFMSTRRATVLTLTLFSAVSLLLASIGLYGVMAYYILLLRLRNREIVPFESSPFDEKESGILTRRAVAGVRFDFQSYWARALCGTRMVNSCFPRTSGDPINAAICFEHSYQLV